MREEQEKRLFNKLIKSYGFAIEEYADLNSNNSSWAALKYTEQGVIAIVCIDAYNEDTNIMSLTRFLNEKNQPYYINAVIYTNNPQEYSSENQGYSKIIVHEHSNIILKYNEGTEFIVNLLKEDDNKKKVRIKRSSNLTLILISINVIIFLITAFVSRSILDIDAMVLYRFGAKENFSIAHGEYYRLLTAAFLHGGLMHITLNMYALYMLGDLIERIYGKIKYIAIYLLSAIASSYLSYRLSTSLSIGASGAIFGLLGAALVYGYKERNHIGKDFLRSILSVIVVNVVLGLSISNIDNFGHIGGLIGGIIIAVILYPRN
ncbi:rhomboid protease GluP [Clostridium amylolyticum]|uniref:Rhomboid protease GluP n=1 Tax=Clostridium amylolyticum TaxID=1121298 RepID=A0A1M6MSV3_9CLOT|nr:rhomboid family intramembrane serine protease [Clostridium amylolyticum]SHJ86551.1 rhomboid protease GluP [Clostridium amylolyticum]